MMSEKNIVTGEGSRKIKIVLSDLHLGKGYYQSSEAGINTLEEFLYDQKLIELLHYYSNGEFINANVELIINGDFLNLLQVDFRGHHLTVITESVSVEMLEAIITGHKEVFTAMGKFLEKPEKSITYVMGNHDQAMLWPECRAKLNQALGQPIKYKNLVYFFEGVHVEHGHMYEAANRFDPRRFFLKKDLAEPILNLPIGSLFFLEMVLKIKERYPYVDKIRPVLHLAKWSFFNRFGLFFRAAVWSMKFLYQGLIVKDPRRSMSLRQVIRILAENLLLLDLSHAARQILKDPKVNTVIFGHNHVYEYRIWAGGKEYFNCGTWTEIVSLDVASLGRITKLSYVYLEYNDASKRYQGRLKEWHGYHRIEQDVAIA